MADYNIQINAQDNASASINRIQGGLGGLAAGAGRVKAALGAAFAVGGIAAVGATVTNTINQFDDLAKSARMAGAATSNEAFRGFQVLKQAMAEAGIEGATFERAMLQTTSRLQKGAEGAKGFSDIVDKLGPSIRTANGELKEGPVLLQEMINALNEGTISTDEFAKVVGGRAGPLIQQQFASIAGSAEGLSDILNDVEANSNIVDLSAAENAEVFNDTIGRLKEGLGQLLTDAVTPLLPHLVELSQNILANMPQYIEAVKAGFDKMQPVLNLIGTVLTDLVVPVMTKLFEALGTIAEAITPLVEASLPYLRDAFDFVATAVQTVFDNMVPLYETALPYLQTGFNTMREVLGFVFDKVKALYDIALPALQTGLEGIRNIVESLIGFFQRAGETIQNLYDKAIRLKNGVTGAASSMAEGVTQGAKDMYNGATGYASQLYQEWWGGSIFPDLRDGVISAFRDMATQAIMETQHMAQGGTQAASMFAGGFDQIMRTQFAGSLDSAMMSLQSFANNFMSQLGGMTQGLGGFGGLLGKVFGGIGGGGRGLFGGLGGIVSKVGGFVKNIFGGFFANGGYLPAGKIGIAGEAGPEIISGPANITPMTGMGVGGGGVPVTININAIDTQTGTQFLLNNRDKIEGIIQRAYNKQGRQGIY